MDFFNKRKDNFLNENNSNFIKEVVDGNESRIE